jgi:hypothetical protein
MLPAESPSDDLDALPAFDAHTWIGTGKIFSASQTPLHVLYEKYNQLKIPDVHLVHFPALDLPVTQFTALLLPAQSTEIIITAAKIWFSKDEPCTDVTCLLARPIPHKDFLAALNKSFGQSWLDGSRSIIDQRYNDGRDRLPLWALTFWQKMAEVTEKQAAWKRSARWLDTEEAKIKRKDTTSNELQLARRELSILGWDVTMDYQRGGVSSSVLSALLSTVWLSDEHINMMMEDLGARLALDPDMSSRIIIASLAFQIQINNNAKVKTYTKNNSPLLYRYHQRIEEGLEKIYFPINVNGDHWIAGVIDLQAGSVGYGMNTCRSTLELYS